MMVRPITRLSSLSVQGQQSETSRSRRANSCFKQHVKTDFTLAAPDSVLRLCDHVVDPVYTSECTQGPETAHERFQGASWPSSASHEHDSPVLGLSVDDFATPVAALTDHDEIASMHVGSQSLFKVVEMV